MALLRYGPIAQVVSGTIGTVTFRAGKSAGVLARAGRLGRRGSASQAAGQSLFSAHMQRWEDYGRAFEPTWNFIARNISTPNRVGVKRVMTGRQAFLRFLGERDPDGSAPDAADVPPVGGVCGSQVIDWVMVNDSWLMGVNTWPPIPDGSVQHLWIRRALNYGQRDSGGRRIYLGAQEQDYDYCNWWDYLEPKGITLLVAEELGFEIRWTSDADPWLSPPVYYRQSVQAG